MSIKPITKRDSEDLIATMLSEIEEDVAEYLAGYEASETLQAVLELDNRCLSGRGWKHYLSGAEEPVDHERWFEWFYAQKRLVQHGIIKYEAAKYHEMMRLNRGGE